MLRVKRIARFGVKEDFLPLLVRLAGAVWGVHLCLCYGAASPACWDRPGELPLLASPPLQQPRSVPRNCQAPGHRITWL